MPNPAPAMPPMPPQPARRSARAYDIILGAVIIAFVLSCFAALMAVGTLMATVRPVMMWRVVRPTITPVYLDIVLSEGGLSTVDTRPSLEVLVTDAQGRRTGVDFATRQVVQEIPGSEYYVDADRICAADDSGACLAHYHSIRLVVSRREEYRLQLRNSEDEEYAVEFPNSGGEVRGGFIEAGGEQMMTLIAEPVIACQLNIRIVP